MADIQTQLPVKISNSSFTVGITGASALQVDGSAVTQPVSGTITASPVGTYTVAGAVTTTPTGTQPVSGTITNVPSGTQPVSGTVTATPTGTYTVAGTVTSSPTGTYTVTSTSMSVLGTGTAGTAAAGVVTIQGIASMTAVKVDGSAVTQPVIGTVTATPTGTYTVGGTVTTVPSGTQAVSGTFTATPSGTQAVSGTVTATPTGTYTVTATSMSVLGTGTAGTPSTGVISVQGINSATPLNVSMLSQTGIVCTYQTSASLANNSTATMSYTVTTGKTLYLKGIFASSSGAPCKVTVNYGAGPTVVGVGFYSASNPYLAMSFAQPPAITSTTVVNVLVQNNAGAAQDVYCTIMGEER